MDGSGWAFVEARLPELALRTGEHLILAGSSTGLAVVALGLFENLGDRSQLQPGNRR